MPGTLLAAPVNTLTSGTTVVVSASSGVVQVLTSGTLVVQTSGTTTIVSASSGLVQTLTSGPITGTVSLTTGVSQGITSTYKLLSSVSAVKTAAGRLMGFSAFTTANLGAWLSFYDASTANVTVGTSVKLSIPIQMWSSFGNNSTSATAPTGGDTPQPVWFGPQGIDFTTAISCAPQVSASGAVLSSAAGNNVTGVSASFFYV